MPRQMQPARRGIWLVAVALVCAGLTPAQEREAAQQPDPPAPPDNGGTTLVLMVRTKSNLNEAKIKRTLVEGLRKAKCEIDGAPAVERIAPEMYDKFEAIINNVATPRTEQAPGGDVSVRLLPTREPLWEFRLPSTDLLLKKLVVYYRKAGAKEYVPSTRKDAELTPIVAGRYSLRVLKNDDPIRYEATVENVNPDVKDTTLKGLWARNEAKCFIITMRSFRGNRVDRDRLFAIIKDPEQVKKPLDDIQIGRDFQFVFGKVESDDVKPGEGEERTANTLALKINTLRRRKVQRVWMLLPLDKETMLKERDRYRKFDDAELSEEIRKGNVARADSEFVIGPDTPPTWVELTSPDNGATFRRVVSLKEPRELDKKYKEMWRLLVWEYDDGSPAAHEVTHPEDGEVLLLEDKIKAWSGAGPTPEETKKKTP